MFANFPDISSMKDSDAILFGLLSIASVILAGVGTWFVVEKTYGAARSMVKNISWPLAGYALAGLMMVSGSSIFGYGVHLQCSEPVDHKKIIYDKVLHKDNKDINPETVELVFVRLDKEDDTQYKEDLEAYKIRNAKTPASTLCFGGLAMVVCSILLTVRSNASDV